MADPDPAPGGRCDQWISGEEILAHSRQRGSTRVLGGGVRLGSYRGFALPAFRCAAYGINDPVDPFGCVHRRLRFLPRSPLGSMVLVVTGVGFLIHIYSVGYMWEDAGYYRFFTYLNLFMFFMLTLVLANNYLLMFIGWE